MFRHEHDNKNDDRIFKQKDVQLLNTRITSDAQKVIKNYCGVSFNKTIDFRNIIMGQNHQLLTFSYNSNNRKIVETFEIVFKMI